MSPTLAAYISVTFVFAVTPGATTAVVVRNASEGGWRIGLRAALGAAAGNGCQALAAGLGLAVVVRQAPRAWAALRFGGGLYLCWLGAQSLWRMWHGLPRTTSPHASGTNEHARSAAIRQGFFANIFNPSVGTFYLVILPSFLPADPPARQFSLYALIHISIAFACHAAWAGAFDRLRAFFVRPLFARIVEGATGSALLWLGWGIFRT